MVESITINTQLTICRTCTKRDIPNKSFNCTKLTNFSSITSILQILPDVQEYNNKTTKVLDILQCTAPQLRIEEDDELPKHICEKCLQKVVYIYQFQQMCIRADQRLRKMLKLRTEDKKSDVDPLDNNFIKNGDNFNTVIKIELDEVSKKESPLLEEFRANDTAGVKFEINKCTDTYTTEWTLGDEKKKEETSPQHINTNDCTKKTKLKFTCDICDNKLSSLKGLKRHVQLHAKNPSQRTKAYESNKDGKTNMSQTEQVTTNITIPNVVVKAEVGMSEKKFTCETCGNSLASLKSLKRHNQIHLRNPDIIKNRSFEQKIIYECTYCNKAFQQSSTLKDHLRVHTGEQPFLCSECGKAFKSLSNMKQHLLRHNSDKRYECPNCPKKFPCLSDLASHKAVHFKNKSHVCDLCGAGFIKPYQLKKHKMYHNGEKPHKCEYCNMRFVLSDHMRRHMRTHTGEKPYKCKYCPRAFAQSNDLIKHLRGHLGDNVYKCELCPQGFRLVKDLRVHFATHKNEDDETRSHNLQALLEEEKKIQVKFGI